MEKTDGKYRNGIDKKHPLVWIRRRAKLIYLRILRIDDPPERIARGASIGVLMGVLPTFGLGMIFSLAAAFVLKANKASAVLGTLIANPLTSPFFWTMSVVVGSFIMREDYSTIVDKVKAEGFLTGAGWAYVVFLVGNVIVSAVSTFATYYAVKYAVIRHRRRKAERLLRKLER
ncbi:MAG TPA: DUF2062 domain-containing protein [Deltaproteobacteria bacterium]|nr:DUF2062 domain-containing protein [Deltaproteobacteria bacterium]HCY11243.1 DUF2062 domain-containing protein [Deltaproteobacteria bacterium]